MRRTGMLAIAVFGLLSVVFSDCASAEYALRSGMPGGGYIFSTSNVAFKGLPLRRYELIMSVRRNIGWYKEIAS